MFYFLVLHMHIYLYWMKKSLKVNVYPSKSSNITNVPNKQTLYW